MLTRHLCHNTATVIVFFACLLTQTVGLHATVVAFDDIPGDTIITGTNYAGLTWEQGNAGLSGINGVWYISMTANHSHSLPQNANNGQASTLMGIGFPSEVNMSGAYFAVQGNPSSVWATAVRVHGYLGGAELGITPWLTTISTTPAWMDLTKLTGVNRIVIESSPGSEGVGAYGMDDLTFTYVPEPTSLAAVVAGGMLLSRRRGMKSI